jgi:iron complex outermembrane recepter protein
MLAGILAANGLVYCVAHAEDEINDIASSESIDEILVTAMRREQPLSSVPLSVHVISEEELRLTGAMQFADYARSVPGLSFTDGGTGGEKQTVRGVSSDPWSEINSSTAVHLDEVPITNAGGGVGPPFNPDPVLIDINRVEVLRGPQGTLFGAGSMGGAIRVITNEPDFQDTLVELDGTLTSTRDGETGFGAHAVVNVPFRESTGALRAVVYNRDLGGFIDNELDGRQNVDNRALSGGRVAAKYQLNDRASILARVALQNRESAGLSHEEPSVGKRKQSRIPESIDDKWTNYNVVLDVDLDWAALRSSTSYLDRDVDTMADVSFFLSVFFGLDNPLSVINSEQVGEFIQEFRLVSTDADRFNWLAGVFYQDQQQDVSQDFPSPGFDALTGGLASMFGPPDNLFVRREDFSMTQLALYGELSWRFTDRVELTGGGRWYDIDRDYQADNTGLLFVMGQLQESFSAGESGFIPRLSLNYSVLDGLSLYATVAEGFRPGGINPPSAITEPACAMELQSLGYSEPPTSYESDSLVSYEAGMRYRSSDGRVRLSGAAYHIDWSDMQTQQLLACGAGFVENAGAADSDGVEFEAVLAATERVEVFLAASYNRAELSDNVPNLNGMKGDRLPGVPRSTARAGASYGFPVAGRKTAFIHADIQYVGDSYMGFNQQASRKLPAYTVGNLRVGLESDSWTATLFIHNLADESGAVFINDNILGEWLTFIRPRTIGASINWRFQ